MEEYKNIKITIQATPKDYGIWKAAWEYWRTKYIASACTWFQQRPWCSPCPGLDKMVVLS